MGAASFRQLLEAGDVKRLRAAWHQVASGMPQPENDEQAEIVMHMTRTKSETVTLRARAYSHRWLTERMLPSSLPDDLKAPAERLFPRVVEAVGVSVNFGSPYLAPAAAEVRGAIEASIEDCYANGDTAVVVVKAQMGAARDRTLRALFGSR